MGCIAIQLQNDTLHTKEHIGPALERHTIKHPSNVVTSNSQHRALVTSAKRGQGNKAKAWDETRDPTPAERRVAMSWAKHLRLVVNIDIETYRECGGAAKVIACIEDPVVIQKRLDPLNERA